MEIDMPWLVVCGVLVLLMQIGFLLREAGIVDQGGAVEIGRKALLNFIAGIMAFAAIGFMLAFGRSGGSPFGTEAAFFFLNNIGPRQAAFFVFQVMVMGVAATIVSGAAADRMGPLSSTFATILLAGAVYPLFAHWVWGNALSLDATAFLGNLDFIDFAGSTVVFSTGGWMALAACMVVGPRSRRLRAHGAPNEMARVNPVLPVIGSLLVFVGAIGFNGGAAMVVTDRLATIIANTVLAGGVGACAGYVIGFCQERTISPAKAVTGMLGGLTAVAAGCHLLEPAGAVGIGVAGATVAIVGNTFVEHKLEVDDAVGAIGIHAFAGAAGTLLLALLVPAERLSADGRLAQLWVQVVGVGINFYLAFGMSYLAFRLFNRLVPMRVTPHSEEDGTGDVDASRRADDQEPQFVPEYDQAERLAALASATFESILIHRDGIVIDGNDELARLVGLPLSDLVGRSIFDFLQDGETSRVSEIIKLNDGCSHEIFIRVQGGDRIPVAARGRDITIRGKKARVGCFVDLRERKEAESRIRYLALHDPLTGLPNRVLFTENLTSCMQQDGAGRSFGIVKIDLDRFKDINDIYGHQAGDLVIRAVATRLLATAGSDDVVSRLGGDEFALILKSVSSEEELETFGRRVLAAMATPVDIDNGKEVSVTVSMGGARAPGDAGEIDALIGCADMALVHAKSSGRNAFRSFRPGMNDLVEKRRSLEMDLELAFHRGEFELYLQPRVTVEDVTIRGYEALLRWNHPTRGMISPADFIPVAEASGKIIRIGQWVLAEACRLLGKVDGHISVNVSPLQFRHTDFVEQLRDVLSRSGADPRRLELEITESVLIDDDLRAVQILTELKRMGLAIALDDFGTGYSSLSYLSRYPFDTIKIDRSFVKDLSVADNARMIVRAIIELGVGLGMKIVAEGVETLEEATFLTQAGCHELQGYLLGRPKPLTEVVRTVDPDIACRMEQMPRRKPEMRDNGFAEGSLPRLVKFNS